jgi:hypothetical protein
MAAWIDAGGGTAQSADGRIRLRVPAGAWADRRQLAIDPPALPPSLPGGPGARPIRRFTRTLTDTQGRDAGSGFSQPVELTLPLGRADYGRAIAVQPLLYRRDPATAAWQPVPAAYDPAAATLTAQLDHFSDYGALIGDLSAALPTVEGFGTDLNQGNATVTMPLKVPPGPHGFQPKLTLSYSSGGPNSAVCDDPTVYQHQQASWVGRGWDLSLGCVLMTNFGTAWQRLFLTLNGRAYDLIEDIPAQVYVDGDHIATIYRSQVEEFLWICRVVTTVNGVPYDYFLVRTKDGTEYRFGYESKDFTSPNFYHAGGSREDSFWVNSKDGSINWNPVRWYLDPITDTVGNVITISYDADEAVNGSTTWDRWVYPSQILYNSADAGGPQRAITFNLGPSTPGDPNPTYRSDLPVGNNDYMNYYLDSIDETVAGQLVRKYVFTYETYTYAQEMNGRPSDLLLTAVTECDGTATPGRSGGTPSGNCLPPTTFTYTVLNGWATGDPNGWVWPMALLSGADNGSGGTVAYSYTTDQFGLNGGPSTDLIQYQAVSSKVVQDGQGNQYWTTYYYGADSLDSGYVPGWTRKFQDTNVPYIYPEWRGFNLVAAWEQDNPQNNPSTDGPLTEYRFFRGLSGNTNNYNPQTYKVTLGDGTTQVDSEGLKGKGYAVQHFASKADWNTFNQNVNPPVGSEWTHWLDPTVTDYTPSGLSNQQPEEAIYEDWNVYVTGRDTVQTNRGARYHFQKYFYDFAPPP